MKKLIQEYAIPTALVIAIVGLLGSLYFSEVRHFIPCVLCWYQRIVLYPLVVIFVVGLATRDQGVWRYALPLAIISLGIGVYQLLLVYGVITAATACSVGVSCVAITWSLFGFITIPLLAFLEALSIVILLIAYRKYV
jgi:disulfide bond formation protein DsbB